MRLKKNRGRTLTSREDEGDSPKGEGLLLYTVHVPAPELVQRNFYIHTYIYIHTHVCVSVFHAHMLLRQPNLSLLLQALLWLCFYISSYPASSF